MKVACYYTGLSWIPLALSITVLLTSLIPYLMAVHYGHVNAEFAYISSGGALPPESCIFGEGGNIASWLVVLCVYMAYRILLKRTKHLNSKQPVIFLRFMLFVGIFSGIGMSIVSNFQSVTLSAVHDFGSGIGCGMTTIYIFMSAYASWKYGNYPSSYWIIRLITGMGSLISTILFIVCHMLARKYYRGTNKNSIIYRSRADGGYEFHLCSGTNEWLVSLWMILFFISLAPEFSRYGIILPKATASVENDEDEKI